MVYKNELQVKKINEEVLPSFQFGHWELTKSRTKFNFFIIYRPPSIPGITLHIFCQEFCDNIVETASQLKNVVIVGDFNIHVNDKGNIQAQHFVEMMNAFGFSQRVDGYTHNLGNTLDLVFVEEETDNMNSLLTDCKLGPFLSDHRFITFTLKLKEQLKMKQNIPKA